MALFLTQDQVQELTGFKLKSRQIDYLRDEGIPFRVNGLGLPIVVESDLAIVRDSFAKVEAMPDLKALEELSG